MADSFQGMSDSVSGPARKMWLVTPHDTNELDPLPKSLRANTAGTLIVHAIDSAVSVTLTVVAGERIDVRAKLVKTGTTAAIHAVA